MGDQGFLKQKPGFSTIAIHAGQNPDKWGSGAVVTPIVTATTFKQPAPAEHTGFEYGRSGNPTRNTLEECLAALDGGKHGFTFASGLGATTTIFSLLKQGDEIICCDDVYGGTNRAFRKVAAPFGITTNFVDFTDLEVLDKSISSKTKLVWLETPTNPMLRVIDIKAVSKIVKSHSEDIILVVDNTFLTPYLQRPMDFGADIVMYSLTKYMNGHSDVIMGAAVVNDDEIAKNLRFLQNSMGIVPSPIDCYFVLRSLKTLALRMEHHKKSSLIIAEWLSKHPKVVEVMHPGLPSHPQHEIAKKQMTGHSSVFSFKHEGGLAESRKFLSALKLFTLAESLGGFESLAELPSLMTHASVPAEQREQLGITDALMALRWGIVTAGKISNDFVNALNSYPDKGDQVIAAVAARDRSRAEEFAKIHNIPKVFSSYAEMAKSNDINIVYIGALNPDHYDLSKLFLESGKHVLCEKPLCLNYKQTKSLLNFAKSKNLFMMEALWSRFAPVYVALEKEIQSGKLGEPQFVEATFGVPISKVDRLNKIELGGSAVMDIGIYTIQFAQYIFKDDPIKITAVGEPTEGGVDLVETVVLEYSGGRRAVLNIHAKARLWNKATVVGSDGKRITVEDPFHFPDTLIHVDGRVEKFELHTSNLPYVFANSAGLVYQTIEVARCIKEGLLESPRMSHEKSLQLAKILETVRHQLGVYYDVD